MNSSSVKRTPSDGILHMWTIYERPLDAPDSYVVRRFEVGGKAGGWRATDEAYRAPAIEPLRLMLEARGLTCMPRLDGDEPQIVETWL